MGEDWVISREPRCGANEFDARNNCRNTCSTNADCDAGQWCWVVHDNYCESKPDPNPTCNNPGYGHRCGTTELLARETCGPECRWAGDCAVGTGPFNQICVIALRRQRGRRETRGKE